MSINAAEHMITAITLHPVRRSTGLKITTTLHVSTAFATKNSSSAFEVSILVVVITSEISISIYVIDAIKSNIRLSNVMRSIPSRHDWRCFCKYFKQNFVYFYFRIFVRRCIKYMIDVKKPRVWQWFDLPFFDDEHDFEFVDDKETRDFVDENHIYLNGNFLWNLFF